MLMFLILARLGVVDLDHLLARKTLVANLHGSDTLSTFNQMVLLEFDVATFKLPDPLQSYENVSVIRQDEYIEVVV